MSGKKETSACSFPPHNNNCQQDAIIDCKYNQRGQAGTLSLPNGWKLFQCDPSSSVSISPLKDWVSCDWKTQINNTKNTNF